MVCRADKKSNKLHRDARPRVSLFWNILWFMFVCADSSHKLIRLYGDVPLRKSHEQSLLSRPWKFLPPFWSKIDTPHALQGPRPLSVCPDVLHAVVGRPLCPIMGDAAIFSMPPEVILHSPGSRHWPLHMGHRPRSRPTTSCCPRTPPQFCNRRYYTLQP